MKFKSHPVFNEVKVSSDGKIVKQNGIQLKIKKVEPKKGNPLMAVYLYQTYFSLPKLVLETYKGYPKNKKRHYAYCIDGNIENTNPKNLRWVTDLKNTTPQRSFKNATSSSKLTEKQTYICYARFTKGETLSHIAKDFNVSDMTIHRAIKRVKNL